MTSPDTDPLRSDGELPSYLQPTGDPFADELREDVVYYGDDDLGLLERDLLHNPDSLAAYRAYREQHRLDALDSGESIY